MTGLISTLATIRRLAIPYFRSEDRLAGCLLLASVIALELAYVGLTVLNTQWYNRFYTALQDYDWDAFVGELLFFFGLCVGFVVVVAYQTYLQQWLLIRWRRWMTARYLADWLDYGNHYRMQVLGDGADNPDQRIAEDIKEFIDKGLDIGIGLLSACVSLASFVALLWGLSAESPLHLFGTEWHIPGYLVWAALLYAAFGTYLTNLIGRALIGLNFDQQHYEADFRFSLVRVRENSEQIALLSGEPAERARLLELFAAIATNWRAIMTCQRNLDFFTSGYSQISTVFPFLVASPAYFARAFQLGGLMQTVSAFGRVQDALSFFITIYAKLAEWRAVVDRLAGFERAVALGRAAAAADPKVAVLRRREAAGIEIDGLDVHLPDGRSLVAADRVTIAPDASVLLTGPSGSGKSTLFRAIAGIWPFGSGTVAVAEEADIMVLPQRAYLPVGSLLAAVTYPSLPGRFDEAAVRDVLCAVGLAAFAERLREHGHWSRVLSLGEQERLALARAILHAPDYLFLDEATASLDEPAEAALYRLLGERLPGTTVVSIGHRSTLAAFHRRHLVLEPAGERYRLRERATLAAE